MYSVQRRRTGCITCRERKVKCDEARPLCQRCLKANFNCKGYNEDFVVLERRDAPPRSGAPIQTVQRRTNGQPLIVVPDQKGAELWLDDLNLSPFQEAMCLAFARENLFQRKQPLGNKVPFGCEESVDFFSTALIPCLKDPQSQPAVRALCVAYFGKIHHDPQTMRLGAFLYGTALKEVQTRLNDADQAKALETLRDARFLGVYEMIMMTSLSAWMHHADGMTRLFLYQGPHAFQQPFALNMLETRRMVIILYCLLRQTTCFLAEPDWQTVPWAHRTTPKPLSTQLIDLMAYIPNILAQARDAREVAQDSEELASGMEEVQQKVDDLFSVLFKWRFRWANANPHAAKLVPSESMNRLNMESPLDEVFHFENLDDAIAIVFYNACLLSLGIQGLRPSPLAVAGLASLIGASHTSDGPLKLPSASIDRRSVVLEICKTIEYLLAETHRNLGSMNLIYPLSVVWLATTDSPEIHAYITRVLNHIADYDAFEVSRTVMENHKDIASRGSFATRITR